MPPTFRRATSERLKSESPERLFDDLPRTRDGVASLWSHQADVLRQYFENHLRSPDVAIELPTGAGKTIPALLIAEWRRSTLGERVAYFCPTVQLANQVHAQAIRQGIEAVALHGPHKSWETADVARFESGRSIAVSTYSTIFNSKPALSQPASLLFDDAHAAEQYVAAAWSVSVGRFEEPDLFEQLLDAISGELSGIYIQRLRDKDPDLHTRLDVRLLPPNALRRCSAKIDSVLSSTASGLKFRYTMIRQALERCLMYFGWDGFLIRPYIPPTGQHPHFAEASHRVYISATLGDGGELERAFGRTTIERVPVPTGWDQRASGRRFFVFPELLRGVGSSSLARKVIQRANKGLVLCPSNRQLQTRLDTLVPTGFETFGKGDIEESLDDFRRADQGVLALANRYDGIDLADDACRLTILDGLPSGEHLQERFLVRSLRAGRVLEERLRTRVIQGAGRSTRGLKDYSAVVVLGDDLTRFLMRSEVRSALRTEAQAEIQFGIDNSDGTESDLWRAIDSFLNQDDEWQKVAEPIISDFRREAIRRLPPGTDSLAASASNEVKAWEQAWRGDYRVAGQTAVEVSQQLTDGILTPYRAFWLYLAAAWQQAAAAEDQDATLAASANELFKKAHAASNGTTWFRELSPLAAEELATDPVDDIAIAAIADHPARSYSAAKWTKLVTDLVTGLAGTDPGPFEQALSTLGSLLGANAQKPSGKGRADSIWILDDLLWITLEAKSEATPDAPVSMEDVRQANSHLRSLAGDKGTNAPAGSISLIISPKQLTDPDAAAIAEPHLFLCSPSDLTTLADDAVNAWRTIRATAMNLDAETAKSTVRQVLVDRGLLPITVKERLTVLPING